MFCETYRIRKGDMPTAIFKSSLISHVSRFDVVDSKKTLYLGEICVDVEILRYFSNFGGRRRRRRLRSRRRRNFEVVFRHFEKDDVVDVDVVSILR